MIQVSSQGVFALFFFFFFQAEDGIRDYKVTGVQTCALPILDESRVDPGGAREVEPELAERAGAEALHEDVSARDQAPRSEEHTSELQSPCNLVCRLLLEKKKIRLERNH